MVNELLLTIPLALAELWSWVVWGVVAAVVLAVEMVGVVGEKRLGFLPLTRIVRDRLMKKSKLARLGVFFFLSWLMVHFMLPEVGL